MNPFGLLVRAFRAAVRTEVDRAMADRRRALSANLVPVTPDETARIARFLSSQGIQTSQVHDGLADFRAAKACAPDVTAHLRAQASADIVPFPIANDRHEPTPPNAA